MSLPCKYSIVVPVYNSRDSLSELISELEKAMDQQGETYEIIMIDDCSRDDSWQQLKGLKNNKSHLRFFRLSNNFGQSAATLCGFHQAKGEIIITIDDDLQYHPREIHKLIERYEEEDDNLLVFGIPEKHKHKRPNVILSFLSKYFVTLFLLTKHRNTNYWSSFRILSSKIIFYKGKPTPVKNMNLFPWIVSDQFIGHVTVQHSERPYNTSNYTLSKKWKHALPTFMMFSSFPLKYFLLGGFVFVGLNLVLFGLYFTGLINHLKIFAELFIFLFIMVNACILISLAIISRYVSNILLHVKGKPEYHIIEEL